MIIMLKHTEVTMNNNKQSNKPREINSPLIKQLIDETSPDELGQIDAEMRNYAEGYKEGYNRAIELTKWAISNLIPPHNEQQ